MPLFLMPMGLGRPEDGRLIFRNTLSRAFLPKRIVLTTSWPKDQMHLHEITLQPPSSPSCLYVSMVSPLEGTLFAFDAPDIDLSHPVLCQAWLQLQPFLRPWEAGTQVSLSFSYPGGEGNAALLLLGEVVEFIPRLPV